MKSPSADAFRPLYTELQMERDGLFAAVARAYRCQTVLSPGCPIHVNPSFHSPHVVYVDTSDTARRFSAAAADVLRLVEDRKRYARPPHVRFLPLDFTRSLPLRDASFELVLALHAGGIARLRALPAPGRPPDQQQSPGRRRPGRAGHARRVQLVAV